MASLSRAAGWWAAIYSIPQRLKLHFAMHVIIWFVENHQSFYYINHHLHMQLYCFTQNRSIARKDVAVITKVCT